MPDEMKLLFMIKMTLVNLGLHPANRGFKYVTDAIYEYVTIKDPNVSLVLQDVAIKYGEKLNGMDRAMRLSISCVKKHALVGELNKLAGFEIVQDEISISVQNFIIVLGELILFKIYLCEKCGADDDADGFSDTCRLMLSVRTAQFIAKIQAAFYENVQKIVGGGVALIAIFKVGNFIRIIHYKTLILRRFLTHE